MQYKENEDESMVAEKVGDADNVADADTLDSWSRSFYEFTLKKLFFSLVYAGLGFIFLGEASGMGGMAKYYQEYAFNLPEDPEDGRRLDLGDGLRRGYQNAANAYAFGTFCMVLAFILACIASAIMSPIISGSPNEKLATKGMNLYN